PESRYMQLEVSGTHINDSFSLAFMDKVQKSGILFVGSLFLLYMGPMIPILNIVLRPLLSIVYEFGTIGYYGVAAILYFVVIAAVAQDVLENNHSKLWLPIVTFAPILGLIAYELARN
ncbi:MAG: hypothetical protein ABEJ69_02120, partial [Candidatus Nanohaloarchaea archaeon]